MRILVKGCGSIGRRHASNLASLRQTEGVAPLDIDLHDQDTGRAEDLARTLGLGVAADDALHAAQYDAWIICTPNTAHIADVRAAIAQGAAAFVEKPVAHTAAEAECLIDETNGHSARIMVGCNLRFHPGVRTLKHALEAGSIGTVRYARALFAHALPNWRHPADYRDAYSAHHAQGGGILLDAIHEPDYLSHLFGLARTESGWARNSGALDVDVEDMAEYVLAHEMGVTSFVHVDYLRDEKKRACEVVGDDGVLQWESIGKKKEAVRVFRYTRSDRVWVTLYSEDDYSQNEQYLDEMAFFVGAVRDGRPLLNGLDEATATLRCIENVRPSSPLAPGCSYQRAATDRMGEQDD